MLSFDRLLDVRARFETGARQCAAASVPLSNGAVLSHIEGNVDGVVNVSDRESKIKHFARVQRHILAITASYIIVID